MNSADFINEVKSSSLCPENFDKIYEEFQVFQKAALNTLLEVHRVCEKNMIPYQVAYGSLLGFIRDGGQIPWDYDIDIIVPFEERKKLVEALKKDLDTANFYFLCPETSKKCRYMVMRVAPIGYHIDAVHVDVFFLVGSPENNDERKVFAQELRDLTITRYGKFVRAYEENLGNIKKTLKTIIRYKIPTIFTSLKSIENKYNDLCTKYSTSDATYCVSADTLAVKKDFPSKIMWETKLAECEYGTVRIPVHYEEVLELLYGDYKSYLPLESRLNEMLNSHKRITILQKKVKK